MSILPEVTTPAPPIHPDFRDSERICAFTTQCVEATRKRRDPIERLRLLIMEAPPWRGIMTTGFFDHRSYLYRFLMNPSDGSPDDALQVDSFDLEGCRESIDALVFKGSNSILVEPASSLSTWSNNFRSCDPRLLSVSGGVN